MPAAQPALDEVQNQVVAMLQFGVLLGCGVVLVT